MPRPYPQELRDRLDQMLLRGLTFRAVGDGCGLSRESVAAYVNRNRARLEARGLAAARALTAGGHARTFVGKDELFKQMWLDGVPAREIAEVLEVNYQALIRRRAALGLPARPTGWGAVKRHRLIAPAGQPRCRRCEILTEHMAGCPLAGCPMFDAATAVPEDRTLAGVVAYG